MSNLKNSVEVMQNSLTQELATINGNIRASLIENIRSDKTIILQPVVQRFPNRFDIHMPSRLLPKKKISCEEFFETYANQRVKLRVCFEEDIRSCEAMLQRSELLTAYNSGLDCWHVVLSEIEEDTSVSQRSESNFFS